MSKARNEGAIHINENYSLLNYFNLVFQRCLILKPLKIIINIKIMKIIIEVTNIDENTCNRCNGFNRHEINETFTRQRL